MTLKISTHIIDKIKILYVFLTSAVPSPNNNTREYQSQSSATVRQTNTQQETCSPTLILTLGTASTGARGKSMGSVAASWKPTTRARGLQPSRSAACDVISTRAAAASFRVEALPAVTVPFSFCEAHRGYCLMGSALTW